MTNAIETTGLTRRFGRVEAVEEVSLEIPSGSIFALVGPNGAGKTTTIKVLLNLIRPSRGTATVLGIDSQRLDDVAFQRIGYVSENQKLPDHLTPRGLLEYCRPFYPTWDDDLARRLQATLNLPMNGRLRSLSRGTRMKAALLSALAFRPELLVLDEPFGGHGLFSSRRTTSKKSNVSPTRLRSSTTVVSYSQSPSRTCSNDFGKSK
jgi:ABC-2 type transport system ATP-binding protein